MSNRHHLDLVPRAVRQAVVEAVGGCGRYAVAEIADLSRNEGFGAAETFHAIAGGQRKGEAERYRAAIDFAHPGQVAGYLRVVEKTRYAEFAARTAVTYVSFVLDTLHEPDTPWRPRPESRPRPRRRPVE